MSALEARATRAATLGKAARSWLGDRAAMPKAGTPERRAPTREEAVASVPATAARANQRRAAARQGLPARQGREAPRQRAVLQARAAPRQKAVLQVRAAPCLQGERAVRQALMHVTGSPA